MKKDVFFCSAKQYKKNQEEKYKQKHMANENKTKENQKKTTKYKKNYK